MNNSEKYFWVVFIKSQFHNWYPTADVRLCEKYRLHKLTKEIFKLNKSKETKFYKLKYKIVKFRNPFYKQKGGQQ